MKEEKGLKNVASLYDENDCLVAIKVLNGDEFVTIGSPEEAIYIRLWFDGKEDSTRYKIHD